MYCGDGYFGVQRLSVGVLEEAKVCSSWDAFVVRVDLYVHDLLVLGPCDGDGGGDSHFDSCVDGGQHSICLRV